MFQGVTNMPNLVAFNALYPWSWTSNYGNQLQFNYQNIDVPRDVAYMAQNAMNPAFWANYNLGFSMQPIMPFNNNDAKNQQAINNAYNQGYMLGETLKLQGSMQSTAQGLNTLTMEINQDLAKENLPADKKQKLEAIKKKLEAAQKKLEELAKTSQGRNPQEAKEQLDAIRGEILELKEAKEKIEETLTETTTGTGTGTGATGTGATTGTGAATGATGATGEGEGAEEAAEEEVSPEELQKQKTYLLNQVCHMLDKAIDGPGTDYDGEKGMKTVIESLVDKDNVIELFDQWNKTYGKQGSYADDEYGFIETLMDDCEGDQKEEIATLLIDAMEQRAIEKGIDVDTEVSAARTACKSNWIGWRNDDKICEAMIALYNKFKS